MYNFCLHIVQVMFKVASAFKSQEVECTPKTLTRYENSWVFYTTLGIHHTEDNDKHKLIGCGTTNF